jgi:hypothetical protein
MKRLANLALILLGGVLSSFAQGAINMDNSLSSYGLAIGSPGNYYSGFYGLELWVLNGTTLPSNINNNWQSPELARANLLLDGFVREQVWTAQTISAGSPGTLNLGEVHLPDVSPAGSQVTLGLVAWAGGYSDFYFCYIAGVVSFVNPTSDYSHPVGSPPALTGWDAVGQDLVMVPWTIVPEPNSFALFGLGGATLVLWRRRR